jgi:hypothetical protein
MAKDTPERFAKLVIAELADIHALVLGIQDYVIADLAERSGEPIQRVAAQQEKKRNERAHRILDDLLKRVDLPKTNTR